MKTYLVTGAAGFIGANFIKHMLAKFDDIKIVVLDLLTYAGNLGTIAEDIDGVRCEFVKGDICDRALADQLFEKYNFNYVVNFAAESHVDRSIENPQLFLQTGGIVDSGKAGEAPGIGSIVDGDLISLVEDHIAGLGGDLHIVPSQRRAQRPHLFKAAVVLHLHSDRALGQQFPEFFCGAVILKDSRKRIVSHSNFQHRFLLSQGLRILFRLIQFLLQKTLLRQFAAGLRLHRFRRSALLHRIGISQIVRQSEKDGDTNTDDHGPCGHHRPYLPNFFFIMVLIHSLLSHYF